MNVVMSERFVSVQGEGPRAGRPCAFVRLGRCDLKCTWCDTPYTWDWDNYDPATELHGEDSADIIEWLREQPVQYVDFTGGEPMLQRGALKALVTGAYDLGMEVDIETNGRHKPFSGLEFVSTFNVSPKLASSGNGPERYVPDALEALNATRRAIFKFVICCDEDIEEIEGLVNKHGLDPVWLMPEGRTPAELAERSYQYGHLVLDKGWNWTTRQQILLFGDRRGT